MEEEEFVINITDKVFLNTKDKWIELYNVSCSDLYNLTDKTIIIVSSWFNTELHQKVFEAKDLRVHLKMLNVIER